MSSSGSADPLEVHPSTKTSSPSSFPDKHAAPQVGDDWAGFPAWTTLQNNTYLPNSIHILPVYTAWAPTGSHVPPFCLLNSLSTLIYTFNLLLRWHWKDLFELMPAQLPDKWVIIKFHHIAGELITPLSQHKHILNMIEQSINWYLPLGLCTHVEAAHHPTVMWAGVHWEDIIMLYYYLSRSPLIDVINIKYYG